MPNYSTTDLYQAAALEAHGLKMIDIIPDDARGRHRYRFVFEDAPNRVDALRAYHNETDSFPSKRMASIIRALKNRLYAAMNDVGGVE